MRVISFAEQFFWTMVWIFLILIIGFAILSWFKARGGTIGDWAGWISGHAEPQN